MNCIILKCTSGVTVVKPQSHCQVWSSRFYYGSLHRVVSKSGPVLGRCWVLLGFYYNPSHTVRFRALGFTRFLKRTKTAKYLTVWLGLYVYNLDIQYSFLDVLYFFSIMWSIFGRKFVQIYCSCFPIFMIIKLNEYTWSIRKIVNKIHSKYILLIKLKKLNSICPNYKIKLRNMLYMYFGVTWLNCLY